MKAEKYYIHALRCPNIFFFLQLNYSMYEDMVQKEQKVKKLTTRMQLKAYCCLTSEESQNLENNFSSEGIEFAWEHCVQVTPTGRHLLFGATGTKSISL